MIRSILTTIFLFIIFSVTAKDYFVSNSGNDANTGTSATSAWKSITKLNSAFNSLLNGDRVLFERGGVFYGCIKPSKSFTAGTPLIISAYGTGANPVITGFTSVTSWSNLGSNIWESTSAVSTLNDVNCVLVDNVNTAMGRYPNNGYLKIDSHVGTTSITSSTLAGGVNWGGADLVMKTWNFATARNRITSQSGNTLNYTATTVDNGHDGYGFFIENDARTLDSEDEWYYNSSTKKIRIFSSEAPPFNVKVSTLDTLVYIVLKNYITFDGIDFTGSNRRAFYIGSSTGITIQNCGFYYHGLYAVWGGNNHGAASDKFNFNHNDVEDINSQAVVLQNEYVNPYIGYNIFKNCGVLPGMFKVPSTSGTAQWFGAYGAVYCGKTNGLVVEYNTIDRTGYTGIHFTGNNTRINNNEVSNHCSLLMDGGGIYTWTGPSGTPSTASKIYNNIVHNGIGNNEGTTEINPLCQGIYLDENTRNTEVYNNTLFSNPYSGIFSNSNTNCNIHDNISYGNGICQILYSSNYSLPQEKEQQNTVTGNTFVSTAASQNVARFTSKLDDVKNFFTFCDNNIYARPIDDNITFYYAINNQIFNRLTLAQWKANYPPYDKLSAKSPKAITNPSDLRIEYNNTGEVKQVLLHAAYVDMKGNTYNGSATLQPYTSLVLIKSGTVTSNISPKANAGVDQTISL